MTILNQDWRGRALCAGDLVVVKSGEAHFIRLRGALTVVKKDDLRPGYLVLRMADGTDVSLPAGALHKTDMKPAAQSFGSLLDQLNHMGAKG